MAQSVIITCASFAGSTTRTIRCNKVVVSLKKNNETKPTDNGTTIAYVQTNGYENPRYSISGVHFTGEAGTLTYADLLVLLKLKYGTSAAPTLAVTYGNSTQLVGIDGTTTNIKVIIDSVNFPIDVSDSRAGYMPTADLVFTETK